MQIGANGWCAQPAPKSGTFISSEAFGSFSIHMEEQDESTCDLSTQLKQTARREWEKSTVAWMHLRSGICFGCIDTWNPAYVKIFIK